MIPITSRRRVAGRILAAWISALGLLLGAAALADQTDRSEGMTGPVPESAPPAAAQGSPFSVYRPNYLILGPENSPVTGSITAKFQLSVMYDTGANWYFAYSQRAYWDITHDSGPIIDMSIEPEVFYFWRLKPEAAGRWNLPAVRVGFVHESNGEDGADSRAWNRAYVEPQFRWGGVFLEPRIWAVLATEDNNSDITDYYGYFDLVLGYETAGRQRFSVTGRQGSQHGSVRLDYSLPLQSLWPSSRMRPWLYAQAWAGYGETLLYYDLRTYAVRIGIEFHP